MACQKLAEIEVGASLGFELSSGVSITRANEKAASASFAFSYATSGEPDLAGSDSTMFLVPSLNIVFSKSLMVEYSPMTCIATGTEVTSWSLTGNNNFKVCSLFSKFVSFKYC
jgi:hypothetical protein